MGTPGQSGEEAEKVKSNLLRDKRAALRNIDSDASDIEGLLTAVPAVEIVHQLAASLESFQSSLEIVSNADKKLMELLPAELSEDEVIAKETAICVEYISKKTLFNKLRGSYLMIKTKVEQPQPGPTPELTRPATLMNSINSMVPLFNINDLNIPKFDGTFANFPEFYDDFVSTVANELLDDAQRLKLLKRAMTGKMENYLKDVGSDGKLYRPTLKGLYDTYFNRRRIIAEHFATIIDLPQVRNNDTRDAVDQVKRALRGLEVCNIDIKALSPFVAFLVARKIPDKLRQDWDTSNSDYSMYQSFDSLSAFLNKRCLSHESFQSYKTNPPSDKKPPSGKDKKFSGAAGGGDDVGVIVCPCCNESHYLDTCKTFSGKSAMDRFNFCKLHKLCLKCFKKNHSVTNCKSKYNCKTCSGMHHTLLHRESNLTPPVTDNESKKDNGKTELAKTKTSMCAFSDKKVFLSTAVVVVKSRYRNELGRVLLDPGSEATLVTEEFCNRAKLTVERNPNPTVLVSVHGNSKELRKFTRCILKSRFSDFSIAIEAEVVDKIPYSVTKKEVEGQLDKFSFEFAESFELPYDYVDLLLGNEYYEFCMLEKRHFFENMCLKESQFGVVLSGSAKRSFFVEKVAFCGLSNVELDDRLNTFFDYDVPASNKVDVDAEFELIEKHFRETYSIDPETGRFIIRLPVRESIRNLTSSYEKAKALLIRGEKKRSPEEHKMYCQIFDEYKALGHMRKVENFDVNAYFIPHHLVKMSRIVFNASFAYDGISSLNSHLLPGPVLQPKLLSHIIRFRIGLIVVSADIFRMYRSILVHPDDWIYQLILFRYNLSECIDIYALMTLANGIGPASYIATRCLEVIAEMLEQNKCPIDLREFVKACERIIEILVECIRKHFYMDNFMRGFDNVDEAIVVVDALRKVLDCFGFHLCKFQSNSAKFLSNLDSSLIDELKTKIFGESSESYIKLLGLIWSTESDELKIAIRSDELSEVVTKRVMFSDASKLYDMIGMLSPVSIRAKLILQELWKEGRSWDEPVSNELRQSFLEYREDLELLYSFSLPRCYCYSEHIVHRQLIGFCDASTKAYCAVLYLRSVDVDGNIFVAFICAKTRVAPIKPVQIHRLELLSMQLLADLVCEINSDLKIEDQFLFSDSMVSLSWINLDPGKLLQFVSNRVRKILGKTDVKAWRHVDGIDNPADCATRGMSATALLQSSLWKVGPAWLNSTEFEAHVSGTFKPELMEKLPERKIDKTSLLTIVNESLLSTIDRSSFRTCVSIVGFVLRFIRNIRCRIGSNSAKAIVGIDKVEPLSVNERIAAFNRLVIEEQKFAYGDEYNAILNKQQLTGKNKLRSLDPFIDENGLLRVKGRLSNSAFSFDAKYPMILPAKCRFAKLYVEYLHTRYYHASRSLMSNLIRSKFWIVGNLLSLIKITIYNCVICSRLRATTVEQIMSDLPKERVEISRPFTTTGVDFSGHKQARCVNHRSTKYYKVYIAFFVCFTTRAVHLELVEDLSTEAFVDAFQRFIDRRGLPRTMYSDNGTNFVGFRNLLMKKHLLDWNLIPPRSPHQGGLWESAVKAGKACILKAIGNQVLSYSEWNTLLTKVEAILNSRPLSYTRIGNEIEPLTPAHFLIGSALNESPIDDRLSTKNLKVRYRLWRSIVDSFWSTWKKAYMNQLQVRNKWQHRCNNLKVDDVVVVKLDDVGVMEWPLGLVVEVYPDVAGSVRTVTVRLANGSTRRTAVKNLVLLPVS